jgi:hypothetical protein
MTVKQLLIGTLVGMTAVGAMLHRLPRQAVKNTRSDIKPTAKASTPATHSQRLSPRSIG